jgi:hypothetical protein
MAVLVGVGVAVLAIWLAYSGERTPGPGAAEPGTTAPTRQPTGGAGSPPTSTPTTTVQVAPLADLVPGLTGTLHAVVGGDPFAWVTWEAEHDGGPVRLSRRLPPGWPLGFALDASGARFAFVTHGPSEQGSFSLHVADESGSATSVVSPVTSFAWHQTEPAAMAVITVHPRGRTTLATFQTEDRGGGRTNITDVPFQARVAAWGDWGFLLNHYDSLLDEYVTSALDASGDLEWQRSGRVLAVAPAADNVLLVHSVEGGARQYTRVPLDTAGPEGDGAIGLPRQIGGVAWSTDGRRLGVAWEDEASSGWRMSIYNAAGELSDTVALDGQVWDVEWSADDRFVLMPGINTEGEHAVLFYDTVTDNVTVVELETWVQWATVEE